MTNNIPNQHIASAEPTPYVSLFCLCYHPPHIIALCYCTCCINKQAVCCQCVKLFLSISAIRMGSNIKLCIIQWARETDHYGSQSISTPAPGVQLHLPADACAHLTLHLCWRGRGNRSTPECVYSLPNVDAENAKTWMHIIQHHISKSGSFTSCFQQMKYSGQLSKSWMTSNAIFSVLEQISGRHMVRVRGNMAEHMVLQHFFLCVG